MNTEIPSPEKSLSLKRLETNLPAESAGLDVRRFDSQRREEPDSDDSINLIDYWHMLLRRKWTIIGFFVITLAVTVTSLYLSPRIYRATALIKIDLESLNKGRKLDEAMGDDSQMYYDPEFYQTQYELIKSRSLAERVGSDLNLGADEKNADGETIRPSDMIQANTTLEPVRNSKLVKLHYNSTDPELAARVANALADTYIKSNLERRYNANADAKNFLEQRIVQVKAKLEDAEHKLYAHAREQGIININIDTKDNQSLLAGQLKEKSQALAEAERQRLTAESIFREARNSEGLGSSKILSDLVVQDLKKNKAKLELTYQEKVSLFKPDYPAMVQLQEQINQVNAQIQAEINTVRSALEADYQLALNKENMLKADVASLKEEVMKQQDAGSDYNILKREVDTSRALYDGILQRLKEIGVTSGIGTNNISIIDPAEVPEFPFKPKPKVYLLIGIFLGLFGGIGLALLFEKLDDTVKLPEDMERLRLATLGIIPVTHGVRDETGAIIPLHLISHSDPRSGIAEAYRSLRTALTFSTNTGAPKVLHLTSSSQGEGKSTSAVNLAVAFTQLGQTVLLIDGDMRRPSLHRMLNLEGEKGLSHYLSGEAQPAEVSHSVVTPNLFVIPAGPLPPNPSELLASARMVDLISLAGNKFDRVIIDSPPVLGLADALILSGIAQHTIMVVAAGKTSRSHAISSLKRLQGARANLLGGLLTMVNQRESGYNYHYNYHYSYEGSHAETQRLVSKE
jgi:capsular exopolysaccharide synthesis family protein